MKVYVAERSLQSKLKKAGLTGKMWEFAVQLVNELENWFFFTKHEGDNWDKYEQMCIECSFNSKTIKEAQKNFDLRVL